MAEYPLLVRVGAILLALGRLRSGLWVSVPTIILDVAHCLSAQFSRGTNLLPQPSPATTTPQEPSTQCLYTTATAVRVTAM